MDKIEALRLIEEVRRETRQPKVLKVCDELERVMLERPVPGNTSTQPVDKLSTRRHSVDKPVDKPVDVDTTNPSTSTRPLSGLLRGRRLFGRLRSGP
jgi:hypothetical protein